MNTASSVSTTFTPADLAVPAMVRGKIKSVAAGIQAKQAGDRRLISGIASKPTIDRYREIIDRDAFVGTLDIYHQNPVLLAYHDPERLIGTVKLDLRPDGLYFEAELVRGTPSADEAWQLIQQGALRAVSIGFRELDTDIDENGITHITKLELYELSLVSIPANREALFTVKGGRLVGIEMLPEQLTQIDDTTLKRELERRHAQLPAPLTWRTEPGRACSTCATPSELLLCTEAERDVWLCARCLAPKGYMVMKETDVASIDEMQERVAELEQHAEALRGRVVDLEQIAIAQLKAQAAAQARKLRIPIDDDTGLPILEDDVETE